MSGYERTYELVKGKLADCDLEEAAARLGFAAPQDGRLALTFLGRRYLVSQDGVECEEGDASRAVEKSLLVYYLTSKGSGEPADDYIFVSQMTGTLGTSAKERGLSWQMSPLEQAFSGKEPAAFCEVMERLGAERIPSDRAGFFSWRYRVLPKICAQICYFEADEEFPCVIQMKFDRGISRYLAFEPAAFLQGCLVRRIRECADL